MTNNVAQTDPAGSTPCIRERLAFIEGDLKELNYLAIDLSDKVSGPKPVDPEERPQYDTSTLEGLVDSLRQETAFALETIRQINRIV